MCISLMGHVRVLKLMLAGIAVKTQESGSSPAMLQVYDHKRDADSVVNGL